MSTTWDVREGSDAAAGIDAAVGALQRGELVVLPTDTVYGLAADAFSPGAVRALLEAKGRGRDMPVAVLVGAYNTLDGLAEDVPQRARDLVEAFWPGGLTLVVRAAPSLSWDLGETRGTVGVRMPLHPVTLSVLARTGPLAVSQRQPQRPARGDRRRRGGSAARHRRPGLPRRRHQPGRPCEHRARPHRRAAAGAARGRGPQQGAARAAARPRGAPVTSPDAEVFRVLHVCTGNICRSPMAERLTRAGLDARLGVQAERVQVRSAGTWGHTGSPMEPHALTTLGSAGIDGADFRARELAAEHVVGADLVLAATREHRASAVVLQPRAAARTFTLLEFARLCTAVDPAALPAGDVVERARALVRQAALQRGRVVAESPAHDDLADPYHGPLSGFEQCARIVEDALRGPLDLLVG